jgi:toxin ParE1/3/4
MGERSADSFLPRAVIRSVSKSLTRPAATSANPLSMSALSAASSSAESDLAEIWFYVAGEASEAAATGLIDKIKDDREPFGIFPSLLLARAFRARAARCFLWQLAIYYLHDERELVIVRVLHGARDAGALAAHGGFVIRDEK